MLKLVNVSKYYYNKGLVTSGFQKINLNFNIGEFVAITGESGSGKTTLLNVISGLDTYEEGQMYINGEETSYYRDGDFEEYRKKYIANIFQNFNLINSYTVYQNIEIIYKLNNIENEDTKEKIYDLLKKVDLYKFKDVKASKLSGGQKQRVAIARALAKDTPIIVADEPTGNLDSTSSKSIIELLYEVSKDKLVIIVTHNYEQVKDYVTRKIVMHDGKILEDRTIVKINNDEVFNNKTYGDITKKNIFKLSFRNTFNVLPKFLLLLIVYLFIIFSVISEYSLNLKSNYDYSLFGYNEFFINYNDKRIVIKKKDGTSFNDSDYEKIKNIENIDYIIKEDLTIDYYFDISDNDFYIWGSIDSLDNFSKDLDYGRLPTSNDEVVVYGSKNDYELLNYKDIINKPCSIRVSSNSDLILPYDLKIVGIKFFEDEYSVENTIIYMTYDSIKTINTLSNKKYSDINLKINDTTINLEENASYSIVFNDKVKKGEVIIPDTLSYICNNYNCNNSNINIDIKNMYFSNTNELLISNTYNKNNIEELTGYKNYDEHYNEIYMNYEDYYNLFDKGIYQSSIYIKDTNKIDETKDILEDEGISALYVKDATINYNEQIRVFINLIRAIGIIIVLIALFFISYFIIKIILKSRNIYYSTLRILGAKDKDIKEILILELNNVLNIAFLIVILLILLVSNNILNISFIKSLIEYLNIYDYFILCFVLFFMSLLISFRYSKSLFKSSAMNTYRSEV